MDGTPFWLQQLPYHAPMLLACGLGLLLGLVNWRRCPTPALMTVLGSFLLLGSTLAVLVAQSTLFQQMRDGMIPAAQYARLTSMIGLAGNGVRAVGLAAVVIAVFVGRSRPPRPAAYEDDEV